MVFKAEEINNNAKHNFFLLMMKYFHHLIACFELHQDRQAIFGTDTSNILGETNIRCIKMQLVRELCFKM